MPATIEARGLLVVRDGRRIVDDAVLRVEPGQIVAIEGPSGSGKSTLLRAIATLIEIDAGHLLLDGVDAREIAPTVFRRRVAYVAQQPPMLEGTVARNIATGPALRGEELFPEEIGALLDRVGLSRDFADRDARPLSGGERARVALARALANRPEALLLDEPTSALDPATASRVVDLVRALAKSGLGIVLVTHMEEHARALGDVRYVCDSGRLTQRVEAS